MVDTLGIKIALIIGAYLLGSIPCGLILSRVFAQVDVRKHGSHNIGATNVYRTLGKKLGVLTLLGDVFKGFLPGYLVCKLTGADLWIALAALASVLGHLYPIYLKFSGGKGVATGLGVFLVLAPKLLVFSLGVFILTLLIFRYVSLSSISAAISLPLLMGVSLQPYPKPFLIIAAIISLLIVFRHKENIRRMLKGEENKIKGKN